jgi:hypothetical protein
MKFISAPSARGRTPRMASIVPCVSGLSNRALPGFAVVGADGLEPPTLSV